MKHATIILAALLSGCAIFSPPPGTQLGDTWVKKHDPLPYRWEVVSTDTVIASCQFARVSQFMACARRLNNGGDRYCLIQSNVSESEASAVWMYTPTGAVRTLDGKPETLASHERKHCDGFDHMEAK